MKFRFYNKELIEIHKLLDSQYLNISTNDLINNINFSSETYKVKEFANHAAINFKYNDISEAIDYKEQLRYKYSSLRKIAPDVKTKYNMFGYTIRKHE